MIWFVLGMVAGAALVVVLVFLAAVYVRYEPHEDKSGNFPPP